MGFVGTDGTQLTLDGTPWRFIGINMWQAVWIAQEDPARLRRELDRLAMLRVQVVRITAASEGSSDTPLLATPTMQPRPGVFRAAWGVALDIVLEEMHARGMRAILTLNNQWTWSGGFATYLVWARGRPWQTIPFPASHLEGYWESVPPSSHPHNKAADWDTFQTFATAFFDSPRAMALAEDSMRWLLLRTNTRTGVPYADDPTSTQRASGSTLPASGPGP